MLAFKHRLENIAELEEYYVINYASYIIIKHLPARTYAGISILQIKA